MVAFRFRILLVLLVAHIATVSIATANTPTQMISSNFALQQPDLGSIFSAVWSSDGSRIATGHRGNQIGIWDGNNGQYITSLPIQIPQLTTIDLGLAPGFWSNNYSSGAADRTGIADAGVQPLTVVEHFDVVEQSHTCFLS